MTTPNIAEALKAIDHWIDRIEFYKDTSYLDEEKVTELLRDIKKTIKEDLKEIHSHECDPQW